MISQKVKIRTLLPAIIGCFLFLTAGCTATYELTIPDGHPTKADLYEPSYEPSQTLVKTDPVDTRPARSEQWDDEEEEHEHHHDENHHHDHPQNDEGLMEQKGALRFNSLFHLPNSKSLTAWKHSFSLNPITNRHQKGAATGYNQNRRDAQ